jgi:tripartite-type tricarboxylate transporter receptor subunit TctC
MRAARRFVLAAPLATALVAATASGPVRAAARRATQSPDFVRKVEQEGLSVVASEPAELDRYVRTQEALWRRIVQENNLRAQ